MSIDNTIKVKKYFEIEKLRDLYSRNKNLNEFNSLYTKGINNLKDLNTSKFWNKKNLSTSCVTATTNRIAYERHKYILKSLPKVGKILNVGFGSGELEKLHKKDSQHEWHGIDISDASVRLAKKMHFGNFRKGSIFTIPYPDNSFNCVIVSEVLEHISPENNIRAWNEVNRVLKPQGTLVVSVPVNEGLEEMLLENKNPNGHLRAYTFHILIQEAKRAGFIVIKSKKLYAFRNLYWIKSLIVYVFKNKHPNNLIIVAKKP